tara:strand:- start:207 stop:425 length:219 start_codon:yes stop_codon:yes gene_type:complete
MLYLTRHQWSLAHDFETKTNLLKLLLWLRMMPCFGFIDIIPLLFDTPVLELFLILFAAFAQLNTGFFRSFNV